MKVTYSWIIYSCLIFGTGILCDKKLERRQAGSSRSENTGDKFNCSNGQSIEWSLFCDGHVDCSDGSDEIKKLCALYEFEINNITMDCGRVHNIKNQVSSEEDHQSINELAPWAVAIFHRMNTESRTIYFRAGSIISPNIVISAGHELWEKGITSKQTPINDGRYKIGKMVKNLKDHSRLINVTMIYMTRDSSATSDEFNNENLAIFMFANEVSFRNGFVPICIDWVSKYNIRKEIQMTTIAHKFGRGSDVVIQGFFTYMENSACIKNFSHRQGHELLTKPPICVELKEEVKEIIIEVQGSGLGILYSNTYFLTGIMIDGINRQQEWYSAIATLKFIDIKYHIPWIRGILNKHVTVNSCVLPTVEGVIYSYEGSNEILSHGTLIDRHVNVTENCKAGYHKAYLNSFRICLGNGKWFSSSYKLCFKNMCPPLLSDSLVIKCSYNDKYANCSSASIPDTIAIPSCKPTYSLPNGQKQISLALRCQSNGTWDKELYRCKPAIFCVLPTVEGVIYTYGDSNESLSHGTLIDLHLTVKENCKFGYHKVYPNSFRVCYGNGKWKSVSDKLCLKMCPPLVSDSLDIECTLNRKYANCSNPSIPDTIATPECKPFYTAPNGHENLELLCQPDGTWNIKLFRCNPSCGKNHTINNGLIINGETVPTGTAPWNVGVYRYSETNSNNYDLICGGSIISPKLVVSAAQCFWTEGMSPDRISVNDDLYKVAVGKYSRNITIIDNEFTKIMNVETVYLNKYYGRSGRYANDIAIVVLRNIISFTTGVSRVCVDWTGINTIPNGAEGKITGWGKTEKDILSPILLEATLPYIDHSSCKNMFTTGFELYVTDDKFCAGSALGQGVSQGDSGAGLSFLHSNLYYLTGVVSVKDPYTNGSIAAFTDVKHHIEWIRRLHDKYN